ncbi:hypothetical protein E2C01_003126 [Portunus trituberculatus]|uniref:Uncharacterized protein n=1 Tax=Portunus trituberculatus TaxID=210409 RepID=A0A5B7CLR4_PORTR|nr:hypothetical protein [Portunus trituberculatus]
MYVASVPAMIGLGGSGGTRGGGRRARDSLETGQRRTGTDITSDQQQQGSGHVAAIGLQAAAPGSGRSFSDPWSKLPCHTTRRPHDAVRPVYTRPTAQILIRNCT